MKSVELLFENNPQGVMKDLWVITNEILNSALLDIIQPDDGKRLKPSILVKKFSSGSALFRLSLVPDFISPEDVFLFKRYTADRLYSVMSEFLRETNYDDTNNFVMKHNEGRNTDMNLCGIGTMGYMFFVNGFGPHVQGNEKLELIIAGVFAAYLTGQYENFENRGFSHGFPSYEIEQFLKYVKPKLTNRFLL